jgi:23S rRNA pseudouridine2605 synthase
VASRRNAEELILAGKVTVNGAVITQLGTRVDPEHAVIRVSNRIVKAAPKGVILLNKPTGVVTTLSDPEGRRTVADYLTKHYRSYFPVGRLDYDSSGLVILTNDGDLANQLLHPRYEIDTGKRDNSLRWPRQLYCNDFREERRFHLA